MDTAPFAADFALSVTEALRTQMLQRLGELTPAPLTTENLEKVRRSGGIYQLFLDGELIYIGKAKENLQGRLGEHRRKLFGRRGGLLSHVTFRCVYVAEDLDAVAPEKMLIAELPTAWNNNGFGNNDPGKNRDKSHVKEKHFDHNYPIDLGVSIEMDREGRDANLLDLLNQIKDALPYIIRFSTTGRDSTTLRNIRVSESGAPVAGTAYDWLTYAADHLPEEWRMVALPGRIIVYPSLNVEEHVSRIGNWVRVDSKTQFEPHEPEWGRGEIDDVDSSFD